MMPSTEQTQEEIGRNLHSALAAALGEPENDPSVRDLVHDILYAVQYNCWETLPLIFQSGKLISVNGKTYPRDPLQRSRQR